MKVSAGDAIRTLMRVNGITRDVLSKKAGYATENMSSRLIAKGKDIRLTTYGKLLKVFDARLIIRYPFPDGTEHEIELDIPAKEKDDEIRMQE